MIRLAVSLLLLVPAMPAAAQTATQVAALREPDVIYVPTPEPMVDKMFELVKLKKGDVLYDLGSGDGRIPIRAAQKFGVRGVGIDINPVRIAEANENAKKAGVTGLVQFRNADLFETDFREATVVTLYLLPTLNDKLLPQLLALKPGTRIVSHAFPISGWTPEAEALVDGRPVFMWRVPAKGTPIK
ncbi:SAM-dependent methyltransferase [Glacieibacterium frigidum]|uniref:Class I SAM-dependent methyltransferase n=1 Tax=Glacieibacterium frigidum TaxID=2593303 RepID=A0A552U8W4_9SPHN|nr:class I SAM-dependent methyltransferase [Glacieibacterium frigidum]TRW14648.1 class I SAM-dependent methyltransferase [Glacieibacterium frigidum]